MTPCDVGVVQRNKQLPGACGAGSVVMEAYASVDGMDAPYRTMRREFVMGHLSSPTSSPTAGRHDLLRPRKLLLAPRHALLGAVFGDD